MKKNQDFRKLLKELGRDPRVKRVISKAKRQIRRKGAAKVENFTDLLLFGLAIGSRFLSKKKARALDDAMDIVYPLVQISLLLKENIFDRPEVKEFFNHQSKQVSLFAQHVVARILGKELRPTGHAFK